MSIPPAPFCALTLMFCLNLRPQFSALSNEDTTGNPPGGQEAAKRQVHARLRHVSGSLGEEDARKCWKGDKRRAWRPPLTAWNLLSSGILKLEIKQPSPWCYK